MPLDELNSPLVAISILNWNGWQDTLECLESVRRLDYPNYLAVVVDNGSWNGSADKTRAWAEANLGPGGVLADYTRETALAGGVPQTEQALDRAASPARMVLIRNEENLGFTGGNNVSIHYALHRASTAADYVFLLNNDAKVLPDALTTLVSAAQRSGSGVVGALVMEKSGKAEHPGVMSLKGTFFKPFAKLYTPYPEAEGDIWETPFASGAGMLISSGALRDVFRKRSDYLNSRYFLYYDEFEFLSHARSLGYKTVIAPKARLLHGGVKSGNRTIHTYYTYRNIIPLSRVALPPVWKTLFCLFTLAVLPLRLVKLLAKGRLEIARAVFEGQRDGFLGVMGKWKRHDEVVKSWHNSQTSRSCAQQQPAQGANGP